MQSKQVRITLKKDEFSALDSVARSKGISLSDLFKETTVEILKKEKEGEIVTLEEFDRLRSKYEVKEARGETRRQMANSYFRKNWYCRIRDILALSFGLSPKNVEKKLRNKLKLAKEEYMAFTLKEQRLYEEDFKDVMEMNDLEKARLKIQGFFPAVGENHGWISDGDFKGKIMGDAEKKQLEYELKEVTEQIGKPLRGRGKTSKERNKSVKK